ncbi:MAG: SUMF1/EgtB/PvdO family nonheme iron enzyme [Fibrobacter sp.]|nr:SUMF1/EgtB/PvdO family nonheme iron enzyme [Fibrobacter sp.]
MSNPQNDPNPQENQDNQNSQRNQEIQKKKRNKKNVTVLVLMFLLLVCLFIAQCHLDQIKHDALAQEQENALEIERRHTLDSLLQAEKRRADSLRIADSLAALMADTTTVDTIPAVDTTPASVKPRVNRDSIRHVRDSIKHVNDSLLAIQDSIDKANKAVADSIAAAEKAKAEEAERKRIQDSIRNSDKVPPTAEITPPAGRYFDPIKLKVKCDEIKCKTYLSIGDTNNPVEAGKAVDYNKTGSVYYLAEDSVGNRSPWEEAKYDMASDNKCGKNSYPVPVNGREVCVDAYEYPNKADENPKDMVSQEEAVALCAKEGKHLCSIEEWQAACRGKDNLKYSYGDNYRQNKCNTNTKTVKRSGRKDQCRSWWGMYDMNGNLWEWTSSASKDHPNMFLVAGGAWNTNNASKCTESKFSFYPQNQYPSVGFRCCR